MISAKVVKTLALMGELAGKEITPDAAEMLASDLASYPEAAVLSALSRCRREVRGFPTLSEIISRVDDGRPGAEEAWAMIPKDESGSVVWSDEMAEAFGAARPLLLEGDKIGARMTFKERYTALVNQAREERRPVRFSPSFGQDVHDRARAVQAALERKQIGEIEAQALLPDCTRYVVEPSGRLVPFQVHGLLKQIEDRSKK